MSGHPIQIVAYKPGTRELDLDIEKLKEVLLAEDVRDCNISIISISGATRKGRSFLLNYFLKYLHETFEHNNSNWLADTNIPLTGFAWSTGSQSNTKGLWIWSKIFTKVRSNGEKIGVMLMDSQGTFDGSSSMRDNIAIFSLSTMLSTMHLYNLMDNINDEHLERLEDFIEYGKLFKDRTGETAFQRFIFLIRDWAFGYEAAFGFDGGLQNLNQILQLNDDLEDYEVMIRNNIRLCFEKLDGFLMPNPGSLATTSQSFAGQTRDLDAEFESHLKQFIPAVLSPDNIFVKKINGEHIKASQLVSLFQIYWEIFGKGKRPSSNTIIKATSYSYLHILVTNIVEYFRNQMDSETGDGKPYKSFSDYVTIFESVSQDSINRYNSKLQLGDEEMHNDYRAKIQPNLQTLFFYYAKKNDLKHTLNISQTLNRLIEEGRSYVPQNDFQRNLISVLVAEAERDKIKNTEEINDPTPPSAAIPETDKEKFNREVDRVADSFRAEARRAQKKVKTVAQRIENEAKNIGKDIERETKNAAESVRQAVKKIKIRW